MAIPLALKNLIRIIFLLESQKFSELWVAPLHLLPRRVSMIGEIVAPATGRHLVNNSPAGFRQPGQFTDSPLRVQREDHARKSLSRPCKKSFIVLFNHS